MRQTSPTTHDLDSYIPALPAPSELLIDIPAPLLRVLTTEQALALRLGLLIADCAELGRALADDVGDGPAHRHAIRCARLTDEALRMLGAKRLLESALVAHRAAH